MGRWITGIAGAAVAASALAQPYALEAFTLDNGGGTLVGSTYTLSGTIGQPDASGPLQGATYTLTGGFWPGVGGAAAGCNAADIAEPFGLLDLTDVTTFVQGFLAGDPIADLAPPSGLLDLADLTTFVSAFLGGCP